MEAQTSENSILMKRSSNVDEGVSWEQIMEQIIDYTLLRRLHSAD